MTAILACGRGFANLSCAEIPVPRPGPGQILARVDAAGVCTSILKLIDQAGDHTYVNGWDMEKWPIILGDEGSVTLMEVGADLAGQFRPGQRCVIQPALDVAPIRHRERYRNQAGGMNKCAVGYTIQGLLAQYILVQEEVMAAGCLVPVPDNQMPYFAASMGEPISCVVSAQDRHVHLFKNSPLETRRARVGLLSGGVTVVVGAGAMGRIHAELALRFNPATLVVSDLQDERLRRTVETIGAKARAKGTRLVCVPPDALAPAVMQESKGRGADDVILAVGIQSVQQKALELLAHGGVANLFGGLPRGKHTLEVSGLDVHYREIRLVGSSGGDPGDMVAALDAIRRKDIEPGNYVAATGSLDCAIEVLNMIKNSEIDGKAILYPHMRKTPLARVAHWDAAKERQLLEERSA